MSLAARMEPIAGEHQTPGVLAVTAATSRRARPPSVSFTADSDALCLLQPCLGCSIPFGFPGSGEAEWCGRRMEEDGTNNRVVRADTSSHPRADTC